MKAAAASSKSPRRIAEDSGASENPTLEFGSASSFRRNAGLVTVPEASKRPRFCCGCARTTRGRVARGEGGQSGCVSREGREEEATTRGVVGRASRLRRPSIRGGSPSSHDSQRAGDARRRQGLRWHGRGGTETTGRRTRKPGARESLGAYLSLSDLRRHRARAAVAGNAVPRTLRRPRARRCAMRGTSWFTRAAKRGWLFTLPIVSGKGVRSRLSVTDFRRRSTRPERVKRRSTHETYKRIHSSRAHERACPTPRYIAFSARHDPPRGCVFRPPRRGGGENITKKNTRLVTRPPPRWLFRGGTPPRSCTGTWRARRRPPPRRWRRSR